MPSQARPYVICHMMTTIDGKIASGTKKEIMTDYYDLYSGVESRLGGQALMCGRVTMEIFAGKKFSALPHPLENVDAGSDFLRTVGKGQVWMIGVDTQGKLRWDRNTVDLGDGQRLPLAIIVTRSTPREYLYYLQQKHISYLVGGDKKLNFITTLGKIRSKMGVKRLLLEGGAVLNGSVLEANLIDEISLIITPLALNRSGAPSLFERQTNDTILRRFKLTEMTKMENDAVWLRYVRQRN